MDYQIVLAPEFKVDTETFLAVWNDDAECRSIALATRVDQPPAGYPIDPGTALVFLGGVATTLVTGVVADMISKLLERKFFNKEPKPAFEIVVVQQASGTQLLVIKGRER